MRSVPAHSYQRLSRLAALWGAYRACRRGKSRQPRMAAFDLDADSRLCALHRELRSRCFRPEPWRLRVIRDPKTRLIAAPSIRDRVVHRALLDEIGPCYQRGFLDHSFTGGTGRGPHRAVLCFLAWQRRYGYRLHLDISRYFPSVRRPTLCRLLFRRLHDGDTRWLIETLLEAGGAVYRTPQAVGVLDLAQRPLAPDRGLPIGSYLSQWCGTFYLDGLDHFVKRELKVPGYLRYMDDFVLFHHRREALVEAREAVTDWLAEQRGLQLNPKHREVVPNHHPAVFLGYRISRAGIGPSRKLKRRMAQRLWAAGQRGHEPLIRSLRSYRGLLLF